KEQLDKVKEEKDLLDRAIQQGNKGELQKILNKNSHTIRELVLATDNEGKTALHLAAKAEDSEIARELLDGIKDYPKILKALVLKQNDIDETALLWAAKNGKEEIVGILFEALKNHPDVLKDLVLQPDESGQTLKDLVPKISIFRRT